MPQTIVSNRDRKSALLPLFFLLTLLAVSLFIIISKDLFFFMFAFENLFGILLFAWFLFCLLFIVLFFLVLINTRILKFLIGRLSLGLFFVISITFFLFISLNIYFQFIPYTTSAQQSSTVTIATDTDTTNETNQTDTTNGTAQSCGVTTTAFNSNSELVKNADFSGGTTDWETHVWYLPKADQYGQVSVSNGIATVIAPAGTPNSRVGLLQNLGNIDTTSASSIILKARVKADSSTLAGSGWNGREAPFAVAVTYYDENCVLHTGLSENQYDTSTRMFWNGFYFQEPTDDTYAMFATKVSQGEWYNFSYDLKELNPNVLVAVGFEGAGWAPRSGSIDSISLIVR